MVSPIPNSGRTAGARERLIVITYATIADWSGLSISTVRQYASQKLYDPRDLGSVLQFCNSRRLALGLPPIGAPQSPANDTDARQDLDAGTDLQTPQTGGYDALTAGYD